MSNPITVTVNESGVMAGTTVTVSQANIAANGSVAVTVANSAIASGAGKTIVSSGGIADLTSTQQTEVGQGTIVVTTDGYRYIYSGAGSKTDPASYVILADITPDWSSLTGKPSTFTPSSHASAHGSAGADPVTVSIAQVTGLQTALDGKQETGSYVLTTDSRLTDSREWSAATVTQAQAEAGSSTTRLAYTPERVFQAVASWWSGSAAKTKLDGIASGATANATDTDLRDRATHTGTQSATTITGLATVATSGAYSDLSGLPAAYSLPTASATVLGGVKVGSGLSIDGSSVLSVAYSYTLPAATTSTLGGVIVGTGLSVASGTVSVSYGTSSATACIGDDARLSDARTPTGSAGGDLSGTYPNPALTNSGVTAGTYTSVTVDAKGRVTAGSSPAVAYSSLSGVPSTFAPTAHKTSHATGGSDALTASDIGAAASSHTHAAGDITSGTIASARLPVATVAQSVAGTSASTLVTPQGMHLSRRGSGRSKFFELFSDFAMSASGIDQGTDGFIWGRQVSGSGADVNTYSNRFVSFSRPGAGILSLITGTASNGRAAIDSWSDNAIFRFDQGTTYYETLIYLPTLANATDDYVLRLGFVQGSSLTNDVVAFEYNRANSVNWHGLTGWNGVYTRVDTGVAVAATKWIVLSMQFTSSACTFSINGSAVGTISSNIRPDGGTRMGTHLLKTAGTTSVSVLLDYVYYRHDFNSDRTFTP